MITRAIEIVKNHGFPTLIKRGYDFVKFELQKRFPKLVVLYAKWKIKKWISDQLRNLLTSHSIG